MGNLVFGTGHRLLMDFLKSCETLSEKHGADVSAESADQQVSSLRVTLTEKKL